MNDLVAQDLTVLFNCLHDGGFESHTSDGQHTITLSISCLYLAEKINSSFSLFRLQLLDLTQLYFLPWGDPGAESQLITEAARIFVGDLEILEAKSSGTSSKVHITCNQTDPAIAWAGGTLILSCSTFKLWDEGGVEVTVSELQAITRNYWDDWKARH